MTRFNALILVVIMLTMLVCAGCLQEHTIPGGEHDTTAIRHALMHQLLNGMTGRLQDNLEAFAFSVEDVASLLGTTGISGKEADSIMRDLATSHPAVLSAITVDPNGTVLSAAPESAIAVLGQNISHQDVIATVLSTREPAMGTYFTLRQGGAGVAIVYPVFSPGGEFLGAVSLTFSPQALVTPYAEESETWAPFTYIVTQPDGVMLSHSNTALVGKQIFKEPFFEQFPEILTLATRCITERTGYATFSFFKDGSDEIVPKETFWDTVELKGTEWRVLVVAEKD